MFDVVRDDMRANGLIDKDADDGAKWKKRNKNVDPGPDGAGSGLQSLG